MALPVQLDLASALMRVLKNRLTSKERAHQVLLQVRASLTVKNIQPDGLFGYTKEVHLFPPEGTEWSEDRFDWEVRCPNPRGFANPLRYPFLSF
jgi:hypothetical protein